jgi:hypothetical protein
MDPDEIELPGPEEVRLLATEMLVDILLRMRGTPLDETDTGLYRQEAAAAPESEVSRVSMSLRMRGGFRPSPLEIREMLFPPLEVTPNVEETRRAREREEREAREFQGKTNAFRDKARADMDALLRKTVPRDTLETALNYTSPDRREPFADCDWLTFTEKQGWIREAWKRLTFGISGGAGADREGVDPKYGGKGRHPFQVRKIAATLAKEARRERLSGIDAASQPGYNALVGSQVMPQLESDYDDSYTPD